MWDAIKSVFNSKEKHTLLFNCPQINVHHYVSTVKVPYYNVHVVCAML